MTQTAEKKDLICGICGAEFDVPIALAGHMRSHKPAAKDEPPPPEIKKDAEMVEIMIHHQEGDSEYVSVNILGKDVKISPHWLMQRGQWIKVPKLVYDVLSQAVVETAEYLPKEDNTPGSFTIRPVSYARYAVSARPVRMGE